MTLFYEDVAVGDELPTLSLPLNVYRLVMAAGATRDFNAIHHNSEFARSTGADEIYANSGFLLGMWERCIRDWMGDEGLIRSIHGFAMKSFNYAGDTTRVLGSVVDKNDADDSITVKVYSMNSTQVTVGPGTVTVVLPRRTGDAARTGQSA